MNQSNGMAAYNVAQNPAAQQMLQSFMQGNGQAMVKPETTNTITKKGTALTPKSYAANVVRAYVAPINIASGKEKFTFGNQVNDALSAMGSPVTTQQMNRATSPTTVTEDKPLQNMQNNAPQIDWTKLLTEQGQQSQIQPML